MKNSIFSALCVAAICAAAPAAFAQSHGERGAGQAPGGGGQMQHQSGAPERQGGGAAQERGGGGPGIGGGAGGGAAEENHGSREMPGQNGRTEGGKTGNGKAMRSESDHSKPTTAPGRGRGEGGGMGGNATDEHKQQGNVTRDRDENGQKHRQKTQRGDDREHGSSDRVQTRSGGNSAGGGAGSAPIRITAEKRTEVRTAFSKHRSDAEERIDVPVNIGVRLPRTVRLFAIPEDVVVIEPEFRRYKYFYFADRIIIVDPDTYEIVEILT